MKKLLTVFICMAVSFGFVCAQENDDFQDQFSFDNESGSSILDELQDSNEILAQENDRIAREDEEAEQQKQRERAKKRENKSIQGYLSLGVNIPFNLNTESASSDLYDTPIPLGISAHAITGYSLVSLKTDFNWDFVKYTSSDRVNFLWTASLGITPVHNDMCFLGFYGTLGFVEEIEKYSYISYGVSATALFNFTDKFGMLINLDATYRGKENYNGDEKVAPYIPRYLDTWRICPSVGFSYRFMKG